MDGFDARLSDGLVRLRRLSEKTESIASDANMARIQATAAGYTERLHAARLEYARANLLDAIEGTDTVNGLHLLFPLAELTSDG